MTDLEQYTGLLDVQTGEILPATVGNAARAIHAARIMKSRVNEIVNEATAYLVAESEHRGTKTLHGDNETVTLTGGVGVEYDALDLMQALEAAGCPVDRIDAAVHAEVTYKIDRRVLGQLAAANQDYRTAIDTAATEVEKPYRATVKLRRQSDDN